MVFTLRTTYLAAWGRPWIHSLAGPVPIPWDYPWMKVLRLWQGPHSDARASLWRSKDNLGELLLLACQFKLSDFVANTFTCQSVSMVFILIFFRTFLDRILSYSLLSAIDVGAGNHGALLTWLAIAPVPCGFVYVCSVLFCWYWSLNPWFQSKHFNSGFNGVFINSFYPKGSVNDTQRVFLIVSSTKFLN